MCRLMGVAKFRFDLLARHGTLVRIPSAECSPEHVKARLEEATGLPLHEAFATFASPHQGMLSKSMCLSTGT